MEETMVAMVIYDLLNSIPQLQMLWENDLW